MENFPGKKKSKITLSPGNFRHGGNVVVGLGIVAAMTDTCDPIELLAASSKSSPIGIVSSSSKAASNFKGAMSFNFDNGEEEVEVDESSESYTCVITHLSGDSTRKRVYINGKLNWVEDFDRDVSARSAISCAGVFLSSPANFGEFDRVFWRNDFLDSCFLCTKQLHGLDIFMYRGEKAFCSCDCREKHMRSEDYRDKCSSEAMKSPCSSPHVFLPQLAAA